MADEHTPLHADDEIVDTEACCPASAPAVARASPALRRTLAVSAVISVAVVALLAKDRFHAPEKSVDLSAKKAFKQAMQGMDSSQCNYVCSSDEDCNDQTGPCIYCSGKGSGSGGSCVSTEDDTGGTGLAGDDDTTKPSAAKAAKKSEEAATKTFTSKKKYDVLMNAWQCNYVCESDSDCNSLTGPCIYCSGKGSGSGGTCVSDEDDTGGTGLADDTTTAKKLAAAGDDDTTKTNVWHKHAHSTTCVSDEDCSSEYTCESGQCVVYQPDTAKFKKTMEGMDSSQCNYVCSSDEDCNDQTGPCIYCSGKGSGSGGSCVSTEDDTGGTGLAGDDDTTKPSKR